MPKIDCILCPVDFSQVSINAYEYAQSLAWHYKAKLLLLHVLYCVGARDFPYDQIYPEKRAEVEQELKDFVKHHTRADIQPECIAEDGLARDRILAVAQSHAADLIVLGTHGLRGIDRLMLGSVTERILREAQCPVLAVRKRAPRVHVPSATGDSEHIRLRKILCCTDFSSHANEASEYALSLAKEYGAELTLLHVLEDIPKSTELQVATAKALKKLEEQIPEGQERCKFNAMVRLGKPYQQIIQFALESQSDMVVMGVRGHGALEMELFGSTTYRVIQLGTTPVLAVHI
ncbi:MAG: hypothetical protein CXZ00_10475 [Acidobacteria bacterium]|nr:MAG: hypothetical protein CXZ00_10475 [Acidobacteriota bacterium]